MARCITNKYSLIAPFYLRTYLEEKYLRQLTTVSTHQYFLLTKTIRLHITMLLCGIFEQRLRERDMCDYLNSGGQSFMKSTVDENFRSIAETLHLWLGNKLLIGKHLTITVFDAKYYLSIRNLRMNVLHSRLDVKWNIQLFSRHFVKAFEYPKITSWPNTSLSIYRCKTLSSLKLLICPH